MVEHTTSFNFTGRYFTLGDIENQNEELWFVLHGYGQLSRLFISKFDSLTSRAYVVAPEGLSLFYLQGVSGRVGSTWMTREFRESAIQNYVNYLSSIYNRVTAQSTLPKRTVLFAFSQGAATLIRWVVQQNIEFDEMILWAGDWPTDIDQERCLSLFANKKITYVYGTDDHFITAEGFSALTNQFAQCGLNPEIVRFSGKHEIPAHILQQFL